MTGRGAPAAAGDGSGALRRGDALARCWLAGWRRCRTAGLWLALVAVWAVYDWRSGASGPGPGSWVGGLHLAGVLGFLAGYDGFIRFEEDRSLRLILLQPVRAATVTGAFFGSAAVASLATASLFWAYLLVGGARPPPTGWLRAAAVAGPGAASFVAYALAGSLVLGRDASAVAGLAVLLAGVGPLDRFVPSAAPGWVEAGVAGVERLVPTLHRLAGMVAAETVPPSDALLVAGHVGLGLAACAWLLRRRRGCDGVLR